MKKFRNYKEHLFKRLQEPKAAAAYLNAALKDEDPTVFLIALKDIADAMVVCQSLRKTPSSIEKAYIVHYQNEGIHASNPL